MIVVDASALVDLLLERGRRHAWTRSQVLLDDDMHAPHLIDIEVMSATRRLQRTGGVDLAGARRVVARLGAVEMTRYPHTGLLDRVWALRENLTPADGTYVALAESLGAPLVTTDERLARAPGHTARILSPGTA